MTNKVFIGIVAGLGLINLSLFLYVFQKHYSPRPTSANVTQLIKRNPLPSPATSQTTLHLRAVGDIMLGRAVNLQSLKANDFTWPFHHTIPFLTPADFFVANLENPLITHCPSTSEGMIFCAPKEAVVGLSYAQISLVSLANNHVYNYGTKGLQETEAVLAERNINSLQHGHTDVTTIQGHTIGIIAFDDLSHPVTPQYVNDAFAAIRPTSVRLVLIHWGPEYQPHPSQRQRQVATWLLDAGAHIIIGSHPHVLQPIEQPQPNQLVAYSLGNFVFDQMWSEPTRKSVIVDLSLIIEKGMLTKLEHHTYPVTIHNFGQPHLD